MPTLPSIFPPVGPNPTAITRIKDYRTWLKLITSETGKAQKLLERGSKIPEMGP